MDLSIVKGVAPDGSTMEWVKVKTLGKGSYGVVHLAKPISVYGGRAFAVKTCLLKDSISLQKELQILKRFVGCDNILKSYGDMLTVDHQGEVVYNLFLEYAPGGTLLNLMNKNYGSKIPERDVIWYTKMLLEGVRDIHKRGYVHCDLKPENILVFPPDGNDKSSSSNRLKIADFGLIRLQGDTSYEVFPGTPVYMPPESVVDGKISAALDIWSLGCVVLEMITGKLPWPCRSLIDLYNEIGFSASTPEIPDTMSSAGKDFLINCFKRDPNERWTADMLLRHPFLHSSNSIMSTPAPATAKSIHQTEVNSCLQAIEMCLQVLDD